jgi:predicted Zn-dependent peptidase
VAVCVLYDVGFRSEPEGRTGFAHLFEHLMFEGSWSLPKLRHAELVQGNGGVFNGQTRSDATVYFEQLPATALELGLFLEADRMRAVRLDEETLANQIAVVQEEIRVNVLNRPYGGFPWITLPPVLFTTYNNAHNGYGSFVDLEAATVDDAADFFTRYYAPSNAVLCLAGSVDPDTALPLVERHFGSIPGRPAPKRPSFAEPVPTTQRRATMVDGLAPLPALALGYRVPDPLAELDAYLAAVVAAEVLTDGDASRLHERLVKKERCATHVGGYVGTFGDPFDVRDPTMLQLVAYHPPDVAADAVLAALDDEVERTVADLEADELSRVVTSMQAGLLRQLDDAVARGLMLAVLEQLRGDPGLAARLPGLLAEVTPAAVSEALAAWVRPDRRAVLEVVPGKGA